MADVANSISTSPQGRSNSYATSPCSSSNTLVSPNIVEAIDRIFPKSPSQLLPDGVCSRKTSPGGLPQSQSNVVSSLPCTVSMDHFTTDSTTTATAVFTGLTSSSGTKSPLMSSTPTSQMDLPSLPAQTKVNQVSCLKNGTIDINYKKSDVSKDFTASKRISKADLEIMNNFSNDLSSANGKSGRFSLPENEFDDTHHQEISDSDDMCRPFVQLQKEKKKKKRKHMKSSNERKGLGSENRINSSVTISTEPKISKLTIVRPTSMSGQSSEDDYCLKRGQDPASSISLENGHCSDLNGSRTSPAFSEKGESLPDSSSDVSFSIPSSVDSSIPEVKDSGHKKWKRRQKLPKVTRRKYHMGKNVRQIQNTFLPCFVVLKRISGSDLQGHNVGSITALSLSTRERVKTLSSLCAQNKFECISKQKTIDNVLNYNNLIDNSQCSNSEDEFRIPQGRSLRKRRQDICYVEPSEDDLLEDISPSRKKRSGQNKKDSSLKSDSLDENQSEKEISLKNVNAQGSPVCSEPPEKKIKKKPTTSSSSEDVMFLSETKLSKENKQSLVPSEPNQKSAVIAVPSTEGVGKIKNVSVNTSKSGSSPNLVYVYPKKNIVKSNAKSTVSGSVIISDHAGKSTSAAKDRWAKKSSYAQGIRPSLVSKTTRPLDVASVTPITTLSMATVSKNTSAISFPLGFSGTPLAASSSVQNLHNLTSNANMSSLTVRNNTLASSVCMVKIDGKDYLLSMPASNNIRSPANTQLTSTNAAPIPFPQSSLMTAPGQRLMFYQPSSGVPALRPVGLAPGTVTTKGGNQTFTIPQLSTAVTLPGRVGSNAIHLLPSSLPSSSLLSTPILTNAYMSTSSITSIAPSFAQSRLSSSISPTSLSSSTTRTSISVPKPQSSNLLPVTSGVISCSLQTSTSTTVSTSLPARQVRSLVSPLVASASTAVIRHHPGQSTTTSSSVQLVAPNASGARCFRIIVPGCSTAAGSTARIATLGTSALSSPLTRLSASSTLLPQRKHSADKEMTPEKRAAKRRRLEKKYPLPPGVVIKTEPLDSPATSLTIPAGSVRSLLSTQNIQLITASSRAGVSGVQRFRIISPSTSGVVLGSRPVRFGSNVIIRAPVISPPSCRPLSSASTSLLMTTSASSSTSLSSSSSVNMSSVSSASLDTSATTTTTTTSVSTSLSTVSRGTISLLSPGTLLLSSNTTNVYPVPTSNVLVSSVSSTTIVTSSTSSSTALTSAQVSTLSSVQLLDASSRIEPVSVCSASSIDSSSSSTPVTETGSQKTQLTASDAPTTTSQAVSQPISNSEGSVVDIVTMRQKVEKLQKLISGQEALGLKGARLDKLKELLTQKRSALSELEQEEVQSNQGQPAGVDMGATAEDPVVID